MSRLPRQSLGCVVAWMALPASFHAQMPRDPVPLPGGSSIRGSEDILASVWVDPSGEDILLSVSDGRGVDWSAPIVVDTSPPGFTVGAAAVAVSQDQVVVAYGDQGASWSTLTRSLVRVYDGATGTLGPERIVPFPPTLVGDIEFGSQTVAATHSGGQLVIHVSYCLKNTPPFGSELSSGYLVSSSDGGATFGPHHQITAPDPFYCAMATCHADQDVLHAFWVIHDGLSASLEYQRSCDAGTTLDFPTPKFLFAPASLGALTSVAGDTIALAVSGTGSGVFGSTTVVTLVSPDGGETFQSDSLSFFDSSPSSIAALPNGDVHILWNDREVPPPHELQAQVSTDGGKTWSPPTTLSTDHAGMAVILGDAQGRGRLIAAWRENGVAGDSIEAALSSDGGQTWGAPFTLGSDAAVGPSGLWNDTYQNAVITWTSSASVPLAGGLRPQTLIPTGFVPGATQVGANFASFDDGSPLGWFVLSDAAGDLLLPSDGRNIGLVASPLLFLTADYAVTGPFAATLGPTGAGSVPGLPANLPSPWTLYAVGASFDPVTLSFGDLSDVVRIDV